MSEIFRNIILILVIVGIFFLALYFKGLKLRKAYDFIIRDLENKQAFDPASATELPYAKNSPITIGFRDYRLHALKNLLATDVVRVTEGQRFYLREGHKLSSTDR